MGFPAFAMGSASKRNFWPLRARPGWTLRGFFDFGNPKTEEAPGGHGAKTSGSLPLVLPRQKAIFEQGRLAFLINLNLEKATGGRQETCGSAYPFPSESERLLGSFRSRKAAEWKESWKHSAKANFSGGDKLEEIFVLTRKLLINALGVLSDRFIQNDSLLEKALGEVYHRLPLMIRLILRKKRYLQFILANRERLIP